MPNIKSAIKRVELNKTRALKNAAAKSTLRTAIRRFEEALAKDQESAALALRKATRALDKASAKGLIHQNMCARKKSRLTRKFNNFFTKAG